MCGINGLISKQLDFDINNALSVMNDEIIHRGPDSQGVYSFSKNGKIVGIGMRRLSIIDIESGNQPMFSDDGNLVLVFNGEIYNYIKLRTQLINKFNTNFKSSSDTEVILHLYANYGVKSFGMLDGMFAFTLIDKKNNKIFIARDFFGEKPLFYLKNDDTIIWASELKSIKKVFEKDLVMSKRALALFFQLTYIPAPFTIYENVFKLEPNRFIEIDLESLDLKIDFIGEPEKDLDYAGISFQNAKKVNHDLVMKSIESRSISDVPLGTFLSGGVDSSIISLGLSKISDIKIDTFSIGFEKKSFDETEKSRIVAGLIGSNHHELIITNKSMISHSHDVILNFDEPFADSSALPTYMVSKLACNSVKVALTGDGGDEVYGGYNKYYIGMINSNYTKYISQKNHQRILNFYNYFNHSSNDERGVKYKIRKLLNAISYDDDYYFNIISLGFEKNDLCYLLREDYLIEGELAQLFKSPVNCLTDFREMDRKFSLEGDMLVKVDRASMLTSLECRAPFLNKDIWSFTCSLPEKFLINGFDKKYLLKESFKDYFPNNFLDKSKKGFEVPVGDWLRNIFKEELLGYTESEFLRKQGIFKGDYIRQLVDKHISSAEDNTFKIWTFYCFQKWYNNIYVN
jgi:asparagine synthase (glutamine-hydrolysing)